jgi:hypothetical protein
MKGETMTRMIYRGFEHEGATERLANLRHALIYRGFPHEGLASLQSGDQTAVRLIYRGFWHGAPDLAAIPASFPSDEGCCVTHA